MSYTNTLRKPKILGPSLVDENQLDMPSFEKTFSAPIGVTLGATEAANNIQAQKYAGADLATTATTGATAGAFGGPAAAGIAVAGSLVSNYLAQKAADERAKRERAAAIEKGYGEDQQGAISQIMASNSRALR